MSSVNVTESTSGLILHDVDGDNCIRNELHETDICNKIVQFDNVAMNIQNSSDVIIGPVTQFNGPVTIYQNGTPAIVNNSKLTKSESTSSDTHSLPEKPSITFNRQYVRYGVIPLFLLLLLMIIITIWMIMKDDNRPSTDGNDNDNDATLGIHKILNRNIWGGHPQRAGLKPLPLPTRLVIISHTAQDFCNTIQQCSSRVKSAQEYHISEYDSPDIGYNFLIGGDGNIYVGRGWEYRNFHGINSIGVSFIGNYLFNELTDNMIECAEMLLQSGVKRNKLDENYKLVGHNQTFPTLSPGNNVYKIIKDWPHFSPDPITLDNAD